MAGHSTLAVKRIHPSCSEGHSSYSGSACDSLISSSFCSDFKSFALVTRNLLFLLGLASDCCKHGTLWSRCLAEDREAWWMYTYTDRGLAAFLTSLSKTLATTAQEDALGLAQSSQGWGSESNCTMLSCFVSDLASEMAEQAY